MSDDLNKLAKAAAEGAAEGFGKSLPPMYNDALQPLAKQTGKALGTLGGVINLALSPLQAMVWGYEKIGGWLSSALEEKLKKVPLDKVKTPDPAVAGPCIEALRFTAENIDLREMYANLIAKSMIVGTSHTAHPSFVEIIKNLSSDEALLFKLFTSRHSNPTIDIEMQLPDQIGTHIIERNAIIVDQFTRNRLNPLADISAGITNLERLGLITIPPSRTYVNRDLYKPLKEQFAARYEKSNIKLKFKERILEITPFGLIFKRACIDP